MSRLFSGLAAFWCEWTHGGGWILRDPSGRVNWQCQKCGRWAEPVSESDEADLLRSHLAKCQYCHGTGIDSYRMHGIWPNGEECVEPIKCAACEGFGAVP